MKKYKTIEIKYWSSGEVYMWDYTTREETVLEGTYTTLEIARLNQDGYYVSAVYKGTGDHDTYVMTKEIE